MRIHIPTLALLVFASSLPLARAQDSTPISLAQAMADPDWIGPSVEDAWWRWDGHAAEYTLKRDGSLIRDSWRVGIDGGSPQRIDGGGRADLDGGDPVYDRAGKRSAFVRNGDVFVRDLGNGALIQLTRSNERESRPQWSDDGALVWRSGNDWYRWDGRMVAQAASPKAADNPDKAPKADDLRDRQLRLIETLQDDRDRREAKRKQDQAWSSEDATRAPAPVWMGKDVEIEDSALSPDGRWLLVVTTPKSADKGQGGRLPKYVTESGYEEFEEVRTRVGRGEPTPHRLWLANVHSGQLREIKFDALPDIKNDPLAALRKAAGKDALKGDRPLRIETDRDGDGASIHWSGDSRNVAIMLRSIDNKDRWIATLDTASAGLTSRHRLHDDAWINWAFNEFGWLPDNRTLWYLSEEGGWSHLYTLDGNSSRQLTNGKWETGNVELSRDGRGFLFMCNRQRPVQWDVCSVAVNGGGVREITALGGVESFVQSPDGSRVLVRHSSAYVPPQLAVVPANGDGKAVELTDTRKPDYRARQWIEPQIVQVPSKHGAGTIWGKYYGPKTLEPGRKYPIVMFVHGAGYLQNVHLRYSAYFREQMFHNHLVQKGYIVLDLDYRASSGYGRDWRTAIYRWMGKPELEDYQDGLDWLVTQRQGDRDHAGIYGGSYGGFMTYIALFKSPGAWKAGAALRPVADWSQYNHGYTSNILNTPELDPEAYKRSSPLEFPEKLQDHLLIAHGMIDDNVFFRDSVMMSQRLIELHKDKWTLAPYPMERHGFVHPDSWHDEYRRIDELFDTVLTGKPTP